VNWALRCVVRVPAALPSGPGNRQTHGPRYPTNASFHVTGTIRFPRRVPIPAQFTRVQPKLTFAPVWSAPYSPHEETRLARDRSGGWVCPGRLWLRIRAVGVGACGGDPRSPGETGGRIARHAFRTRSAGTWEHDAAAAGRAIARARYQSLRGRGGVDRKKGGLVAGITGTGRFVEYPDHLRAQFERSARACRGDRSGPGRV
jgi:hypothetical protein